MTIQRRYVQIWRAFVSPRLQCRKAAIKVIKPGRQQRPYSTFRAMCGITVKTVHFSAHVLCQTVKFKVWSSSEWAALKRFASFFQCFVLKKNTLIPTHRLSWLNWLNWLNLFGGKPFLISRNDGRLHSDAHLLPFPRLYNPILYFRLESLVGGDFVLMTVAWRSLTISRSDSDTGGNRTDMVSLSVGREKHKESKDKERDTKRKRMELTCLAALSSSRPSPTTT